MSNPITPLSEGLVPPAPVQPSGPFKNPSYPQRVHAHERPHWLAVLAACEHKVADARTKLESLGSNAPERPRFERLFAQMLGARDQVADSVRRLPGEVGGLYLEDLERLEQAVAALDRVIAAWEAAR
ncbi:MAG: hypothetical protein U0794_19885 [Isosphaeraceae bacterium]